MDGNFDFFSKPTMNGGIKLPVCLILDKSGSMSERVRSSRGMVVKIDELNNNIQELFRTIRNDSNARLMSDVCLIGCGGEHPEVINGYSSVDKINFVPLTAGGRTPLGASVELALDLLQKRREYYRSAGIEHYKPIMMIMSDGQPTEVESVVYNAAQRCSDMVNTEGLKVLPIGIGDSARLDILDMFSPKVKAKCITNMDVFVKLFEMLSVSMSQSDNTVFDWLNDQV
jgi:uncharacterized protein YegL